MLLLGVIDYHSPVVFGDNKPLPETMLIQIDVFSLKD